MEMIREAVSKVIRHLSHIRRVLLSNRSLGRPSMRLAAAICRSFPMICFGVLASCCAAEGATLKTLYSFCSEKDCTDGDLPSSGLLRDHDGNLFGVTLHGGSAPGFQGGGTAFELSPGHKGKWTLNTLHTFCPEGGACDSDGYYPEGSLIMDTAGNLYGVTALGTASDQGVIYELSPAGAGWNYTLLHTFSGPDGAVPSGALRYVGFDTGALYDGISALYGATQNFGGDSRAGPSTSLCQIREFGH
jgi:uncharacterized repeat protein (TIGR03803 family)